MSQVGLVPQVCCELKFPEKVTPMLKIPQGWWPHQDLMIGESFGILTIQRQILLDCSHLRTCPGTLSTTRSDFWAILTGLASPNPKAENTIRQHLKPMAKSREMGVCVSGKPEGMWTQGYPRIVPYSSWRVYRPPNTPRGKSVILLP